ncbi:MAG: hypothetical protein ACE37E_01115 [Hyphomicrobiales bacterium]
MADDTGTRGRRYADAVAMSIWPSRGYSLQGFEVKVSRSDFISEMKDPTKADAVGQYCDLWWLVTPSKLVAPEELPETWGLMELTGAGLRVKKQAPKREPATPTRGFMAALLRRGQDMQQAHIRKAIEDGNAKRQSEIDSRVEEKTRLLKKKVADNAEWQSEFEQRFGVKPSDYRFRDPSKLADAIKLAEGLVGDYSRLTALRNTAATFLKEIDDALPALAATKGDA